MTVNENLIVVDKLIKAYEGRPDLALKGISVEVKEGECFGLLGPNGAGKTTLMGCLLGLLNPDGGSISIGGLDPNDYAVREIIGFLPERPNFENWLTAREFIEYHHALAGGDKSTRSKDVENMLRRVALQEDAWSRKTGKFSRGMLQRLGLAQALIGNPKIIFLDEPGSGMDPPGVTLLREILLELKRSNATIVLNSHHLDEMERICDRVAFIKNGEIQAVKTMSDESDYPHVLRLRFLPSQADTQLQEKIERVALSTGSTLLEFDKKTARLAVASGESASKVIQSCVENQLQIQSASPESTSLERLFTQLPLPSETARLDGHAE
ncbi:ABC transporter ATP-binding protein [Candidatus Obscuribacterales bacterium]|nr:ABC transporter ATP-binding protein [Candidatus Obscuribacterales bacterium]MBX3135916.1 ABC transporter ATP-binding protein [Candidatus Obscuribacterales bacterium]